MKEVAACSKASPAFANDCMFRALMLTVEGSGGGGAGHVPAEVLACYTDEGKAAAFRITLAM